MADNNSTPDVEEEVDNMVSASKTIDGTKREASVEWDPGASLSEAEDRYGADTVFDLYRRSATVKLQAQIRGRLEQGFTQEQIAEEFSDWRPDQDRTPSRDPRSAILSSFNKLGDAEREALIAQLAGLAQDGGDDEEYEEDDEV